MFDVYGNVCVSQVHGYILLALTLLLVLQVLAKSSTYTSA